ncbi:MAG: GNAT family N-acetyltransferase [Pseudomonadota bacterium]
MSSASVDEDDRTSRPYGPRLNFKRFCGPQGSGNDSGFSEDLADLAALLSDPELTRNITANASSPTHSRRTAEARIEWHNKTWDSLGYGVWALRLHGAALALPGAIARPGRVVGWCGFVEADVAGEDPEILYGLARDCRGHGLGREAAAAAVDWFFQQEIAMGVSAVISARLNPASVRVVESLGFSRRGQMDFETFLGDRVLARDVLDYEIWRLSAGESDSPAELIFQAAFRAGQLLEVAEGDADQVAEALAHAASGRLDLPSGDSNTRAQAARRAFAAGRADAWMDWYHLSREAWQDRKGAAGRDDQP